MTIWETEDEPRMTVDRPDHLPALERVTVARLKHQIAGHRYRVDADAVAEEILLKLRMIGVGRRALLIDSSQSGGQHAQPPPGK